jgi:hypothetical protein
MKRLVLSLSAILLLAMNAHAVCSVQATVVNNVTCNGGCDGQAYVTASGFTSPPYTYNWSTSPAQHGATATNLCAGTYTCTVSDQACSSWTTVTITQPPILQNQFCSPIPNYCYNSNNGCAFACPSGGTPPYTYMWTPTGQNTATICNLSAGNYTCTVTDSHGCTNVSVSTITQPTQMTAVTQLLSNVSCFNGNNGSVRVIPNGGTPGYTYLWTPSGGNGQTCSNLVAGTYTVTVTDVNGCTATATTTITEPTVLTAIAQTYQNVSCFGACDGIAIAQCGGGVGPYTYTWSPGGQIGQTASNLCAGPYAATVIDAHGCTITPPAITITQPSPLTLNMSSHDISCMTCFDGTATATPGGGTGPYFYIWSTSQTIQTITVSTPGVYQCCVYDAHGCSACSQVTINNNCPIPTTQASNITFTNATTNSLTVHWTNGSGSRRVVKIKPSNSFTAPQNGFDYTANPVYIGSGEQVVYNGTGNSVNVTGLLPGTFYWFKVYEANCAGNFSGYQSVAGSGNPRRGLTQISQSPNRPELVSDNQDAEGVIIYPNPAHSSFTITSVGHWSLVNGHIRIYDITGREVYRQTITDQSAAADEIRNSFTPGVYLIRVEAGNKIYTQKLIIE